MQIGVEGLQALEYFSVKDQTWGEAHKRVRHDPNLEMTRKMQTNLHLPLRDILQSSSTSSPKATAY